MEAFFKNNQSNREFLCRYYDIQIIRRYRLIPGQEVRGIYRNINDLVYEFKAQNRNFPDNKPFFFHTGRPTGEEFIQFANIINITPIFNMLQNIQPHPIAQNQNNVVNNNQQANQVNFDPLNREMLNILHLFFYLYGLDPEKPLFKIYEQIIANTATFNQINLKSLNTIICHKYKLNLQSLIQCVETKLLKNNVDENLRNFNFNGLIAYCQINQLPPPSFF